jgi:hypothetical protein
LGRLVVELQNESNQFAREWIRAIYEQRLDMVVLLAMPPQQRKEETARLANLVSLRDLGLAIPEPGLALGSLLGADREVRSRLITDYPSFFPKLVRGEESVLPAAGRRAWAEKSLLHEPPGPSLLTDRAAPSLRLVGDSVTVSLPCALPPPPKVTGQIKGRLLVGLEGPQIVSRLKALMSEENWRSATPVEDAGRLLKNEPRDWYIEGVEVTAEPSGRPDPRAGMPPG